MEFLLINHQKSPEGDLALVSSVIFFPPLFLLSLPVCKRIFLSTALLWGFPLFNRLFIVDESDQLVGVVSAKDLVAYFMNT